MTGVRDEGKTFFFVFTHDRVLDALADEDKSHNAAFLFLELIGRSQKKGKCELRTMLLSSLISDASSLCNFSETSEVVNRASARTRLRGRRRKEKENGRREKRTKVGTRERGTKRVE